MTETEKPYVIALYIRLSVADRDAGKDGKEESDSITSQRDMLKSFVAAHSEFSGAEILEFCDDGRTGTNFERTGVSKMLDAAKRGQINCIIVKDDCVIIELNAESPIKCGFCAVSSIF